MARRAGVLYGTAIVTALLFAVHPVHVEAVAHVAGRAELLAAGLALTAWLAHRRGQRILAPVLYLLAVLSGEGAVLAPVLFLLDDLWRKRDGERVRWSVHAGYAAALAIALALRSVALGGAAFVSPFVSLGTVLWVMAKGLFLLVWPRHLVSDHSADAIPLVRSWSDPRLLAGVAVLAFLVTAGIWGWRRSRPLLLGVGVFALFLLPAGTFMAERLLYLPSFGVCLIAGHLGADLARRGRIPLIATVVVTAVLLGLGAVKSWTRAAAGNDDATLAFAHVQQGGDVSPRALLATGKTQAGLETSFQQSGACSFHSCTQRLESVPKRTRSCRLKRTAWNHPGRRVP